MVVAAVYTGAPCSLMEKVELELKKQLPSAVIRTYTDPTIISEVTERGSVGPEQAKRLIKLYTDAAFAGADIIYNICSSVGEVADAAAPAVRWMGAEFVRIDWDMADYAGQHGKRIGVIATLPTTLEPTKNLLRSRAKEHGTEIQLVDALADAFGKSQPEMEQLLVEQAEKIKDQVDIIVLAQASMALCEDRIAQASGKETLSSPRFGAQAVKRAAEKISRLSVQQ